MRTLFPFLLFTLFISGYSQQPPEPDETFRPVFSAGIVGSQVDGDTYGGYNKMGYFAGIGINRKLSRAVEAEFALTFLQKGARKNYQTDSASIAAGNLTFYLFRLNYVEIPVGFKFNFQKKFKAEVGGAFAYLIQWSEQSQYGYYNIYVPKNYDISAYIGLGYKIGENMLVNLRAEYSIPPFRPYYGTGVFRGYFPFNLFTRGLYNNLLIFSLNYKLPALAKENGG